MVFPEFMSLIDEFVNKRCCVSCFFRVVDGFAFLEDHLGVRCGDSDAVHHVVGWVAVGDLA